MQDSLPQLPELLTLPSPAFRGPTPWSNWVIKDRVLAGGYPAAPGDKDTEAILSTILGAGVTKFVCLQAEYNHNTPERAWRKGIGLRPYVRDVHRVIRRDQAAPVPKLRRRQVEFLHLPIIDGNVAADGALNQLADDCCEHVLNGEVLYIHCWGGHGRTGTLAAVMLGRLYGLASNAALGYIQALHDSRTYPQGVRSPQTPRQRTQVRRLLAHKPRWEWPHTSQSRLSKQPVEQRRQAVPQRMTKPCQLASQQRSKCKSGPSEAPLPQRRVQTQDHGQLGRGSIPAFYKRRHTDRAFV